MPTGPEGRNDPCVLLLSSAHSLIGGLTGGHFLSAQPAGGSYHLQKTIQIGGEGGWDYVAADAAGKRLYVSHGTKVVVVDTGTEAVAGEIADTPGFTASPSRRTSARRS